MKSIEVNSGPHKKLTFIGHDDAQAYDEQAGEIGACVNTADLSDVYRSVLPKAHDVFAKILVASGIARGVNEKATAAAKQRAKDPEKVKDVPEQYVPYANRVKATMIDNDQEAEWDALDAKVHFAAAAIACDSSPTARAKGPDKAALAKADDILSREEAAMETTITTLLTAVPDFDLARDEEGAPDRVSLANLINEFIINSI